MKIRSKSIENAAMIILILFGINTGLMTLNEDYDLISSLLGHNYQWMKIANFLVGASAIVVLFKSNLLKMTRSSRK